MLIVTWYTLFHSSAELLGIYIYFFLLPSPIPMFKLVLAAEIESNCACLCAKLAKVALINREIKLILHKVVNKFRKNWSKKLGDAL